MLIWLSAAWAATLAVLPFDNHSGSSHHDALGVGVADMLVTDLGQLGELDLVERSHVADLLAEMALARSDYIDPATAARAGRGVGAEWILVGSVTAVEPELRLDARVVEVASGRVLHTASAHGPVAAFFEVEKDLVFAVAEALGVSVPPREAARIGRVATESFDAFLAWSDGLDSLDRGELEAARERFRVAVSHDSGFAAAGESMGRLAAAMDEADGERQVRIEAGRSELSALIAAVQRGERPATDLEPMVQSVSYSVYGLAVSEQQAICEELLAAELPEKLSLGHTSINEWALSHAVMSAAQLHDAASVLSRGQAYVERYPSGILYPSVRATLDGLMKQLQHEEDTRRAGVPDALRIEHEGARLGRRCEYEPDRRVVGSACTAWLDFLEAHDGPTLDDLKDIWTRVRSVPDVPVLERVLAAMGKAGAPREALDKAERELAERRAYPGELPELRAEIEARIADGKAPKRSQLEWFVRLGALDEAAEWIERARTLGTRKRDCDRAEWTHKKAIADLDGLEALSAAVVEEEEPFLGSHDREQQLKRLRERRSRADRADAWMAYELYEDLKRAGLHRDAAEVLDGMIDAHRDWHERSLPRLLMMSGYAWRSVYAPEGPKNARARFQRIIDEFPDDPDIARARNGVESLPR